MLIHAAAGGVGHLAVQIAKSHGAYVIGTARAGQHEFVGELGVDEAIDYTQQDVGEAVRDVDVVLDLVGGETGLRSLPVLRDGGLLISVPSRSDVEPLRRAAGGRVRVTGILVEPDRIGMEASRGWSRPAHCVPHRQDVPARGGRARPRARRERSHRRRQARAHRGLSPAASRASDHSPKYSIRTISRRGTSRPGGTLRLDLYPALLTATVEAQAGRHALAGVQELLRLQPQLVERLVDPLPEAPDLVRAPAGVGALALGEHPVDLGIEGLHRGVVVAPVVGG